VRVSERDRERGAELRAERIRWRGRPRTMSQASRSMDERLRKMRASRENPGQAATSARGGNQDVARGLGRPAEAWLASV
jgi:hypothetical protein